LGRIRRRFSEEFKREAVRLAREPGKTVAGVARELNVGRKLLLSWREKLDSEPIEGDSPAGLRAELARLRRENERLRQDQEILKKAVAIVSDRPR
jgi:transposase